MKNKTDYYNQPHKISYNGSKFESDIYTGWAFAEKAREKKLRFRRTCWPMHLWCYWCEKRKDYYFNDNTSVPLNVGYEQVDWEFVGAISNSKMFNKANYTQQLPMSGRLS